MDVLSANNLALEDHDVLVMISKLVSVFEGRLVKLSEIKPSLRARLVGKAFRKDPEKVELILGEGRVQVVFPQQIYKIPSLWARLSTCTDDPKALADDFERGGALFHGQHQWCFT